MSEQKQDVVSIIMREVRWPRPAAQRLADALLDSLVETRVSWDREAVTRYVEHLTAGIRSQSPEMSFTDAAAYERLAEHIEADSLRWTGANR